MPLAAALEVVLAGVSAPEQHPHRRELRPVGSVRGRGDGELARVGVVVGLGERQRLERLGRGAEERHEAGVSGLRDPAAVLHRDGVDEVGRLGDAVSAHDYPDGVGGH